MVRYLFYTTGDLTYQSPLVDSIPFHVWRYGPFRALASLKACLHSSLFSALLLHPLTPNSCNASLWTTSVHLVLGLPTGLCCGRFHLKLFLGSSLPPFLLYGPPTLVFWFLYLPRCLDRYIGCTVDHSLNIAHEVNSNTYKRELRSSFRRRLITVYFDTSVMFCWCLQ